MHIHQSSSPVSADSVCSEDGVVWNLDLSVCDVSLSPGFSDSNERDEELARVIFYFFDKVW